MVGLRLTWVRLFSIPRTFRSQTDSNAMIQPLEVKMKTVQITAVSMGNPHAVQVVADVETAPVATQGPLIEHPSAFSQAGECRLHADHGPRHISGCGYTNAARVKPCPAAPAHAPQWWPAYGANCWMTRCSCHARRRSASPGQASVPRDDDRPGNIGVRGRNQLVRSQ